MRMNLRRILAERKLTQVWLAGKLKKSPPYLAAYLRQNGRVPTYLWQPIADALRIPVTALMASPPEK